MEAKFTQNVKSAYQPNIALAKNNASQSMNSDSQVRTPTQQLSFKAGGLILNAPGNFIQNPMDKEIFNRLMQVSTPEEQKYLDDLLKTGRLTSTKSNDKSSTLQNLYKILSEPRVRGLDQRKIYNQTLKTLNNPFKINQKFGDIPKFLTGTLLANYWFSSLTKPYNDPITHTKKIKAVDIPKNMKVDCSGTCVAASMEFNLADKRPAEYARFVAGLTSQDMCVKSKLKMENISESPEEAKQAMTDYGLDYKMVDNDTVEVSIRPDRNAIVRARVQSSFHGPTTRSELDVLMQSTFMQLGSFNTYNSLNDKREEESVADGKGLTEAEKNFAETIVDSESKKTSVNYQEVDDSAKLTGFNFDYNTTLNHLLNSLKKETNVIIGITEIDKDRTIIGGHEITVIGSKQDKNGNITFVCNDTDDDYDGPIEIAAQELIPKIHHAGIPYDVIGDTQPQTNPDLVKKYFNI